MVSLLVPAVTFALLAAAPAVESPAARAVVKTIEERHARVADLTARFVQSYRSGLLGREVVERGVVSLKRPGRMLWEYKDPEKKTVRLRRPDLLLLRAGRPAGRSCASRTTSAASRRCSSRAAGDILGQFDAELETPPGEGVLRLRLTPRKSEPEVERVLVDVEPGGRIRPIQVEDAQGNRSRFRFDDIRENVGLPERLFRFEVPPGVEVVAG